MAERIRVTQLAVELGITSKDALEKLNEIGEYVKSASSMIDLPAASRLRSAVTTPDPLTLENVRHLLLEIWTGDVAKIWLDSPNAYLDGARPSDALALGNFRTVYEALCAAEAGSN